jgi:hypothetical protein
MQIWLRLTADRRRFGALCAAVMVGLLLWARVIIIARVPREAVAEPPVEAAPEKSASAPADNPRRTTRAVELDAQPRHDPFLISSAYFPRNAALDPEAGKLRGEPAEELDRSGTREYAFVRGLAELFELEAVMTGSPKMAVISGQTWQLEDAIPAPGHPHVLFQLVEVKPRSVVLAHGRHRFELTIAAPGGR